MHFPIMSLLATNGFVILPTQYMDGSATAGYQFATTWDTGSNWTTDGGATRHVWVNSSPATLGTFTATAGDVTISGTVKSPTVTINGGTSGTTRITSGTLELNGPTPAMVLNAFFAVGSAANLKSANGIALSGVNDMQLELQGANPNLAGTISGPNTILRLTGNAANVLGTAIVNLTRNVTGACDFFMTGAPVIPNVIAGSTRVWASNSITFTGDHTTTGTYYVSAGRTLKFGNGGTTGSPGSGGVITLNGDGNFVEVNRSNNLTINNNIVLSVSTNGAFKHSGSGTTTLTGTSGFAVCNLNAGNVSVATIGNSGFTGPLGIASGTTLVFNGGGLIYTGATASNNRGFTLTGQGTLEVTNPATTLTMTGTFTGTGHFFKNGEGSFVSGTSGAWDATGPISINAGNFTITGAETSLGGISVYNGVGAQLTLTTSCTANSIGGTGGTIHRTSTSTLTLNGSDTRTYEGALTGTAALTRAGTGTTLLTGTSSMTGNFTVSSGARLGGTGTWTNGHFIMNGTGQAGLAGAGGTLTVASAQTANGGSLDIRSNGSNCAKIVMAGNWEGPNVAGTFTVNLLDSMTGLTNGDYNIIEAGSVTNMTGASFVIGTNSSGKSASVARSGNNLVLTLS